MATRTNGGHGVYNLVASISTNPDNFLVIATADDASRQWVISQLQESQGLTFWTQEIDLTVVANTIIIPPISYRLQMPTPGQWVVSGAPGGTVTTGPQTSFGTNAGINNVNTATVQSNLAGSPADGLTTGSQGSVTTPGNFDLSTNGLRLAVLTGAVLGTATNLKARLCIRAGVTKF